MDSTRQKDSTIQNNVKNASSLKEQCEIIWRHYLSRKLKNNFEPIWTHTPYKVIEDYLDNKALSQKELFLLKEVVKSHRQNDATEVPVKSGFPKEGTRLMHDCWKAGSFTWIFMGRIYCENISTHKDFIVINRKLPEDIYSLVDNELAPQTLYAAYKCSDNFFVGPSVSLEKLIDHLSL